MSPDSTPTPPTTGVRYRVGPNPTFTNGNRGTYPCDVLREGDIVSKRSTDADGDWFVKRETDGFTEHVRPRHLTPIDTPTPPVVDDDLLRDLGDAALAAAVAAGLDSHDWTAEEYVRNRVDLAEAVEVAIRTALAAYRARSTGKA